MTKVRGIVAIIDLSHIFRAAWHATADEALSAAYELTIGRVTEIAGNPAYTKTILAIDIPPYNRKSFFPEYKANREAQPPEMYAQLDRIKAKLVQQGHHLAAAQGFEADDVIATLVKHATADGYQTEIHTNDKDLLQLIRPGVTVVSTRDGARYGEQEVWAKFGVYPAQMVDFLALQGDRADNIPGVTGVGPKTAAKLLLEHGSIERILAAGRNIGGTLGQKILDEQEKLLISAALVQLMDDAPISWGAFWEEGNVKQMNEEPDTEPEATVAEADYEPTPESEPAPHPGDRLIAGARARQERRDTPVSPGPAPVAAVAPAATPANDQQRPAPLARSSGVGPGTTIELRPGLVLGSDNFALLNQMAQAFHNSGLYRRKFESAAAIFSVMELGLELGISPQIALQNFHMIEGKPSPAAHFLISLAERDPNCSYIECVEETETSVTYETCKKKGYTKPLRFTYTLADAEDDGHRWARTTKNRRAMLRKTAGSQAARLWYPAACSGLYSLEEMGYDGAEARVA